MNSLPRKIGLLCACTWMACGSQATETKTAQTTTTAAQVANQTVEQAAAAAPAREAPPASAAPREIHFPPIAHANTTSGLEVNTVGLHGVPVVQIKLVVRAGSARDPQDLQGTAQILAQMLKEGTTKHSSVQLAEAVDFLGAQLGIHNDEEHIAINVQALAEQLPEALALVAELATQPTFDAREFDKLKKRELDRLSLMAQNPSFLAQREFLKHVYGTHPYARFDTTKDVLKRIKRSDLAAFHKRYFAPNNAYLVVVGDVTPESVVASANKVFAGWAQRAVPEQQYPTTPVRNARDIVLVDRPESVQSKIVIGNLALSRKDPDYVPLLVANQVLGGSAASRLFMDLREKQSLTYGAYSSVEEGVVPVPFRATAAVRNEVTAQALKGFFSHLERIRQEPATALEVEHAKRLLVDSFPLHIETPGEIAGLVSELRTYGFPDDYWDGFREQIQAVTPERALEAAQRYITPESAVVVVVGKAAAVKDALSAYGPVRVIDTAGALVSADAQPSAAASDAQPTAK